MGSGVLFVFLFHSASTVPRPDLIRVTSFAKFLHNDLPELAAQVREFSNRLARGAGG
jgi:hypothetical protein